MTAVVVFDSRSTIAAPADLEVPTGAALAPAIAGHVTPLLRRERRGWVIQLFYTNDRPTSGRVLMADERRALDFTIRYRGGRR